jgi:hypothetical protein
MDHVPAGDERIKDKGLNCTYIIARRPENQPTSERAIPCSIFSAEPPVARAWLRKWCGDLGSGELAWAMWATGGAGVRILCTL